MTGHRHRGLLYRALNPVYARRPLSGRGAALYGGRFNRKGMEALYTSLTPETAIREANQVGTFQPTMLLAYEADIRPIFDTRDPDALAARSIGPGELGDSDWRRRADRGERAPTQEFAAELFDSGYAGLLVRSFAPGATPGQLNLVLWRWNTGEEDRLSVVDDEGRLPRPPVAVT